MVVHRVVDAMIAFLVIVPLALIVSYSVLGESYSLRHSGVVSSFYISSSYTLAEALYSQGIGRDLENSSTLENMVKTK